MRCPRCQQRAPADAGFCPDCGAKLVLTCGVCGAANVARHRFCKDCGESLGTPAVELGATRRPEAQAPRHLVEKILRSKAALEGERKLITVLFADLKGSLELLADRDPEDARTLLDAVLDRMMEAVHYYEGTVNQVMGDGIMALFGAPLAHEDHARRACYAALRMQESVARHADELRRMQGLDAQIRIGINSGQVVVRSIGNDLHMDYSAIGETTHLAARMEQLARPGTTLITADTLRLAEGYFDVRSLGPMPIAGLAAPQHVYELIGAAPVRSRLHAAAAHGLSPFMGRELEMEQLHRALEQARAGHGQIVSVVGEAGVGKSRLFYEFIRSPRMHGVLALESTSVSYGRATAYLPVTELLRAYFRIDRRDDVRAIQAKVTGNLLTLDETLRDAIPATLWLFDALPEDSSFRALDPVHRRQRTCDAITAMFLRESAVQPLCLVFEDLHAVDSETRAVLDVLVDNLAGARVLLLVNYRYEYAHQWARKTYHTQLRIDPLPSSTMARLLGALLGDDPSVEPVTRMLIERTEGNPFFLEECVRSIIDSRALVGERGAYRPAAVVVAMDVPGTVQAVLAARIDRLAPDEKRLLQSAAVIGKDVPSTLLHAIADVGEDALRHQLAQLQAAEFLYQSALFPELEYTFKHALTHEVAYRNVLHDRRRVLHGRILEAMERLHADRLSEHVERLGHHALRGEVWPKAVGYLRQALTRALGRSANREAVRYAEEALSALRQLPDEPARREEEIDLRFDIRSALLPLHELTRVGQYLAEAERLARDIGDERRIARALGFIAGHEYLTGSPLTAAEQAERAVALAGRLRDHTLEVVPNIYLAQASHARGENRRTIEVLEANLRHLVGEARGQRFGMPGLPAVMCRGWLALAHAELGEFGDATSYALEARRLADETGSPFDSIYADVSLAFVHLRQGEFAAAVPLAQAAREDCLKHDVPHMRNVALSHLGYARVMLGRPADGLPLLAEAVEQSGAMKIRAGHSVWELRLAEGYLVAGRAGEALDLSLGVLERTQKYAERGYEAYALRTLAEIHTRRFPPAAAEAEAAFRGAARLARELGLKPLLAHCHLGLARLLVALGRSSEAQDALAVATDLYRAHAMTFWLADADALLDPATALSRRTP
ncbi:MAG: AAA family ATPase [Candidatus Rokubacteria bacterium]|nr:AAA family ATPase [Candidatus Rokubacteria bacterium]